MPLFKRTTVFFYVVHLTTVFCNRHLKGKCGERHYLSLSHYTSPPTSSTHHEHENRLHCNPYITLQLTHLRRLRVPLSLQLLHYLTCLFSSGSGHGHGRAEGIRGGAHDHRQVPVWHHTRTQEDLSQLTHLRRLHVPLSLQPLATRTRAGSAWKHHEVWTASRDISEHDSSGGLPDGFVSFIQIINKLKA